MAQEVSLNGRVTNFEAEQLRILASVGGSGGWEREEEKQVCVGGDVMAGQSLARL